LMKSRRRIYSPRLRSTPILINYSRDLRPAKWGSAICLQASVLGRSCPLWVKSGHGGFNLRCPLYPRKQTSAERIGMSVKRQKQTHALQ
jgi:hypothetical protein